MKLRRDGTVARRYVRTISTERVDPVREALAVEGRIGIPDSEFIDGDPPLLVMEPAAGRPHSVLLPVLFLPGVWAGSQSGMSSACEQAGRALGRLHRQTNDGCVVPTEFEPFEKVFTYSETLERRLDKRQLAAVDEALANLDGIETPVSCIYSDPTPHNLYYADGSIEFIDYSFQRNLAVKDLATFERGIELMAGRLPYVRRTQADALVASLRYGYGETGPTLWHGSDAGDSPDVWFRLLDYCYVLDRYMTGALGGGSAPLTQRVTRWTDVRCCLARIDELSAAL